jgi:hypothetical protein
MTASIVLNVFHYSSDTINTMILGVAVLQEVAIWIISRGFFRSRFRYPIDLDLLQGRWGIWVMIVVREPNLLTVAVC